MKILVTGAAGFVGSHLAERLSERAHDVVGLDCFSDYYPRVLKELNAREVSEKGAPVLELDLAADDLGPALDGVEVVYHLAAQPGISATTPFRDYIRNNIDATFRLLEAAKNLPTLRCFINVSTSSVYGAHATDSEETAPKPTSYYGVTKLAAEQLVLSYSREQGFPATSLRLFSVYGERERPEKLYPKLIRAILEKREFPLYKGSETHSRSFTYIGDIIAGFISVLENLDDCLGEIFNIGSDIEITTGEGIRIVEEIMGEKAKRKIVPKRPGDQLRTHANIDKARRILGYSPKVAPEEGLRAEVEWYREKVFNKIQY
ncbi:MAG TPA: NAD-dependent epimerase/dehydratase family protein [Sumerlaeia bacterium]|nr:NAD-dependent epimerase/dehydratase family protein [Sumerlaeia bacterium]